MQWFELKIICRNCRDEKHSLCSSGMRNGSVKVSCTCDCYQEKKRVTDGVGEPSSVTNFASTLEGSTVDDI
jgi:hypothetical protein